MDGVAGEAGREGLLVDGMSTGLSTAVGETVGPGWPSSLGVGPCGVLSSVWEEEAFTAWNDDGSKARLES